MPTYAIVRTASGTTGWALLRDGEPFLIDGVLTSGLTRWEARQISGLLELEAAQPERGLDDEPPRVA